MTFFIAKPTISVIICAFTEKRLNDLIEAVRSLQTQSAPPLEIIVVIDHNEALLKTVRECLPEVTLVENHEAQGASGARNSGVAVSHGQIVAFIDDDAVAEPDWLEKVSDAFHLEHVAAAGGEIKPLWLSQKPKWFPEEFYWVIGATYKGLPTEMSPVRNLWTVNLAVDREAFEAIQGFRSGFGKVGQQSSPEDTDLCIRLQKQMPSRVILYKPDAVVQHKVSPQRATWKFFTARCFNEGWGKANLASLVGADQGTSTERNYMLRMLPKGVLQGIKDGLFNRDKSGWLKAGAILWGLAMVGMGYLQGTAGIYLSRIKAAGAAHPTPRPDETNIG